MADESAQQAQRQAREDSRRRNLGLRKARKAAKSADEKLAQGQHAEALSRFKIAYTLFAEAGVDHNKIREKIIVLDPGWNPAAATVSAKQSTKEHQHHHISDDGTEGTQTKMESPVKKLEISGELADGDEFSGKIGGDRGWADYTPPANGTSAFSNSSPSLLQRVQEAGKRVQQQAGPSIPNEDFPVASSTRPGTFLYSSVSPSMNRSDDGESHLMSVRPVGDQQASALRPPRRRPTPQRSSRSPPPARPGSGQRLRDSMPTSATPYTTPRGVGSSNPFTPSGSRAQSARYEYSGRSSVSTYKHRSPSPSSSGRSDWRSISVFDRRKRLELSVKFDWRAALPSSQALFHRMRVSIPNDDDEQKEKRPEPSWSSAVSQQVCFHGIREQDVAFSFVDDEEDECRITSEEEWLAALRLQVGKGGPLRVQVESLVLNENSGTVNGGEVTGLLLSLGLVVLALVVSGCAAWQMQHMQITLH